MTSTTTRSPTPHLHPPVPRHPRPSAVPAAAALALAIVVLSLVTPAALAASTIAVSPASATQGASVTISGNVPVTGAPSCPSGASAQLTSTAGLFPPDGFGPQAARDTQGNFTTSYTIPASTPAGSYEIGIRCAGGNVGVSATLQVIRPVTTTARPATTIAVTTTTFAPSTVPAPTTTAPPSGAHERGSVVPWIGLGFVVGVLVASAVLLAVARRRVAPKP
jgi:hypothetical protein